MAMFDRIYVRFSSGDCCYLEMRFGILVNTADVYQVSLLHRAGDVLCCRVYGNMITMHCAQEILASEVMEHEVKTLINV